jgi:site-specific recombinase XerC
MTSDLTLSAWAADDVRALRTALPHSAIRRLRRFQAQASAPNTLRSYRAQWRRFEAWCAVNDISAKPPVSPILVAAWLSERAEDGSSRSTIAVACAAVAFAHKLARKPFDASDPDLKMTLAGIKRADRRGAHQAAPLRASLIADLLGQPGDELKSLRNRALLSLLYVGALRRSELVGLDYQRLGSGSGVLRLTARAVEITLSTSKRRRAETEKISIPLKSNPRAIVSLKRWIAEAGIGAGEPVIRRIRAYRGVGDRLSEDSVTFVVRAALVDYFNARGATPREAHTLAATYSSHSGRIGFVVAAAEAGASDTAIARLTRHRSLEMVARYSAQAEQLRTAPHHFAGVGL